MTASSLRISSFLRRGLVSQPGPLGGRVTTRGIGSGRPGHDDGVMRLPEEGESRDLGPALRRGGRPWSLRRMALRRLQVSRPQGSRRCLSRRRSDSPSRAGYQAQGTSNLLPQDRRRPLPSRRGRGDFVFAGGPSTQFSSALLRRKRYKTIPPSLALREMNVVEALDNAGWRVLVF